MMGRNEMFLLFFCLLVRFPGINATNLTRSDLLRRLTNETTYDPNYPPGYDEGKTNAVIVQLDIFDMTSVSEQDMEYTIMMLMRMQWQDERLAFKEIANYSRLDLTGERVALVWTPDLYIRNERKTDAHSFIKAEELVYIDPDGIITFSKRFSTKNYCRMNLMRYPFDVQNCVITIMSYAFTSDEMMLQWSEYTVQAKDVELPNYQISVESLTDGVLSEGHISMAGGTFSFLNFTLKLTRKPAAYGSMYFASYPLYFTVALTSFGFKDQIGVRITLCTSGISASVLQWIAIYSRLPPVWYLTFLDRWSFIHIVIIGIMLVYHSLWYMLLHQSRKEQDQFEDLIKEAQAEQMNESNCKTLPEFNELLSDRSAKKLTTALQKEKEYADDPNEYFKTHLNRFFNDILKEVEPELKDIQDYKTLPKFFEQFSVKAAKKLKEALLKETKYADDMNEYFKRHQFSFFTDAVKEVQRALDMCSCETLNALLESEQLSGKSRMKLINDQRYLLICNRDREKYFEGYRKRRNRRKCIKAIQKNNVDFLTFVVVIFIYSLVSVLFASWANFMEWYRMLLIEIAVAIVMVVGVMICCFNCRGKQGRNELDEVTCKKKNGRNELDEVTCKKKNDSTSSCCINVQKDEEECGESMRLLKEVQT